MIKNGFVVSFEYSLSDEDGTVLESNKGEAPVTYTHGEQQIVPGLERGLSGMEINEQKVISIQPEEAYGAVNPAGFKKVPRENIPAEGLKVGMTLHARGPQGEDFSVRVHEITEETVILDLNHPMAGKTLVFDVKVLDIQPGSSD
ncbi:MAG: peptidylprolyl isomerase [Deltaproteobacteria bacterium]|nr:peptidylprolyl isomerase [Deltaproteobacteria bacterium]